MAMTIKNKYEIGDPVFLVTDPEQVPGQVVYIVVQPIGLMYGVRFDTEVLEVYSMEISGEPSEMVKLGITEKKEK
jgi:hypothetical protein